MDGLAIGRVVIYASKKGERAALITKVYNDIGTVDLFVFPTVADGYQSSWLVSSVMFDAAGAAGTWSWPVKA